MDTRHRTLVILLLLLLAFSASAQDPLRGIAEVLLPVVRSSGGEAAVEEYRKLRKSHGRELDFREGQLNALGYVLLAEKRIDDAILIFELNIQSFPRSINARDSLAEAYMRQGDFATARRHYTRALSMIGSMPGSERGRRAAFLKGNIQRQLERMDRIEKYGPLTGVYRAESGEHYSISFVEPGLISTLPHLRLVELGSGRVRTLHERSPLSYWTGPGLHLSSPIETRVTFERRRRDADATALTLELSDSVIRAERVALTTEEVLFGNGPVELEGTLLLPSTPPPHPAVVLVHGSGAATRNVAGFGELAHALALEGFAVLGYDKRGSGNSAAGVELIPSLDDLAGDARAAIGYLAQRPEIDRRRIGLAGFSEGAWVASIAAAADDRTRFLVLMAGGGVAPWQQDLYRVEAEMRAAGFDEPEIVEAMKLAHLKLESSRSGKAWEELTAMKTTAWREAWYRYTPGWPSMAFAKDVWNRVWSHDPQSVLPKLELPVLVLLGEKDVLTPFAETRDAFAAAFDGDRADLLTMVSFADANHVFLACEAGAVRFTDEIGALDRYVPGFFSRLTLWSAARSAAFPLDPLPLEDRRANEIASPLEAGHRP